MKYYLAILLVLFTYRSHSQNLIQKADSIRNKHHVPEMAFAVLNVDKVLTEQYLGYHKLDDSVKTDTANAKDYFHLGSNTKAITGFIAAYLVEHHKLKWNTNFFALFPEGKTQSNSAYAEITLQDLLSHRAKIEPFTSGIEFKTAPLFTGSVESKRRQFVFYVLKQKPVVNNETYNYSNAGYSVATTMLEKASGKSWEQLIDEIINKKLGLHAKFGWPNKTDQHQPWGHWEEHGKFEPVPGDVSYNLHYIEPAGDISMTLSDYTTFIELNLQGLSGKANLLKPETYTFLHYGLKQYAIGWSNNLKNQISEHDGSAGTFYCRTIIDGKKGIAYIIIANAANRNTQDAIDEMTLLLEKMTF